MRSILGLYTFGKFQCKSLELRSEGWYWVCVYVRVAIRFWFLSVMQAEAKKKRRRRTTHYSNRKALVSSRMAKVRKQNERFEKSGITRVLEFQETPGVDREEPKENTKQYERRGRNARIVMSEKSVTNETEVSFI